MAEYICREYAPARNVIIIRGIAVHREADVIDVIRKISLRRLRDGGAAIFDEANINHHIDMVGIALSKPFIRNILRVCDLS